MNKAEWAAVYDYCNEYACTRAELLKELKTNGTIRREDSIEDLGEYVRQHTYDDMIRFLEESL
jgi:hypothetical protein